MRRLALALAAGLVVAVVAGLVCPATAPAAAAPASGGWPRWEAGGQLSLLATGGELALRLQGAAGRFFGRHEVELSVGVSHLLAATAADAGAAYALHLRWRRLLGFLRGGLGARLEHVGGGSLRARLTLVGGGGLKVRLGSTLGLRVELEYRHLLGAPGVSGELGLLAGPVALW